MQETIVDDIRTPFRKPLTQRQDDRRRFLPALLAPGAFPPDATIGRTLQLGTGQSVSVGELVDLVAEQLGRTLTVELDDARVRPSKSEVEVLLSRPDLARELTGWTPQVSIAEGVRRTIDWIR